MAKPPLPTRPGDTWDGGFLFEKVQPVQSIEARGGMVVAGGDDFYMLKPADESWRSRPPPEDIGPMFLVAAEPRGDRRYAVVSEAMLAVFFKGKEGDQILRLKPTDPRWGVTHLAWGGKEGACSLYVLRQDATLMRMRPDLSDIDTLEVDEMSALASDDDGTVAMVAIDEEESRVYVTRDGLEMSYRPVNHPIPLDTRVDIAVAGDTVALVVDEQYVLLSRGLEAPFERVAALDSPEGSGWKTGPIAFQGTAADAALLCGRWENDLVRIMRVDASGAATSILEMGGTETLDPPEIAALSWDATRQTLWGASPYTGIFRCVAPTAKGKNKVLLS